MSESGVVIAAAPDAATVEAATAGDVAHAEARVAEAEAHAEAAVAIAEVQADAAVQIEEARADAAVEAAEAMAPTADMMEGLNECRRNLETISTNQVSILQRLEAIERHPNLAPPSTEGTLREDGSRRTEAFGQAQAGVPLAPDQAASLAQEPARPKRSGVRWT